MRSLWAFAACCLAALATGAAAQQPLRLATFRCDITPPLGEPMIWNIPLTAALDPLWAKGIVLEQGPDRYVLCTLDWCELCNDSDLWLRQKLAQAAGTDPARVAIATVHQHAAPYADQAAHGYLDAARPPVQSLSDAFLNQTSDQLAQAVRESLARLADFDTIGIGQARVERVASARRLHNPDGSISTRYSSTTRPALIAAPEGDIDPWLKTITLAAGQRPLARLHFYATHPQTFACDGRASADFVGAAREALEQQEGVFQLYFTGCAGNVTVGKYNDGSDAARAALRDRLLQGMQAAIAATRWQPAGMIQWRSANLTLPASQDPTFSRSALLALINDPNGTPYSRVYAGAMRLAYQDRLQRPLLVRCLDLGDISILQLPGEPMLDFQRFAQSISPGRFVAVGGYFDCGPGYICTDAAFREGGYEPSATHAGVGSEARLKQAIREALSARSSPGQ
jgi:hypothetical protein